MNEVNSVSTMGNTIIAQSNAILPNTNNFTNTMQAKLKVPDDLNALFEEAARKYNVPSALLKAVGKAESNFNPRAVSRSGAQGVMQLMPATARGLGVSNSFDPRENIMGGSKYLSQMLKKYDGDVKLALAAYNAGSGNVDKYGGIPPFKETQNYVKKIMGYLGNGEDIFIPSGSSSKAASGSRQTQPSGNSISGSQDSYYDSILQSILNFEDYTTDDYLLLLEFLRYNMQSSVTSTLSADGDDYARQSIFNNSRLLSRN